MIYEETCKIMTLRVNKMTDITHELIENDKAIPFKIFDFHARDLSRIIPPHWHQNTEILFCKHGSLRVKIKNNTYDLHSNDFIIINPNEIHSTQSLSKNWVLCLQLPYSFLQRATLDRFTHNFIFNANSTKRKQPQDDKLRENFCELLTSISDKRNLSQNLFLLGKIYELLSLLVENYSMDLNDEYQLINTKFISKLLNIINKNYQNKLSLPDVAKKFSYSEAYTSRLIKDNLGEDFTSLLISIRLDKSITLMKYSDKTLEEIAAETGFTTYRNLYNAFKRVYQISPKEFIKRGL
jgi:AraC-like DNA-binding protein/mannose-6-phosphate isomerase-like protein (cupin superfamily)